MGLKHQGSCLCGDVKFEVEGEFDCFFMCHCQRCRKGSGSAHASNLFSNNFELKWLSGEENVKTYQVSDTRHIRSFCKNCGSALPVIEEGGKPLMIPAGSLDSDVPVKPNSHIYIASRANWDECLEKIPFVDEAPQ